MNARCALCESELFARNEGEICPHCAEHFARQFRRHVRRGELNSIWDDPVGLIVAVILVFVSGALGYFFST